MTCDCVPDKKSLEDRFTEILLSGNENFENQRKLIDEYFMGKAENISLEATCKKRQIGCVLVSKEGVVLGANGAPENIGACKTCSRMDAESGTQLEHCYALHAEVKVLASCARRGLSTKGGVIYLYGAMPCKNCLMALIEAGVKEIVCNSRVYYGTLSEEIFNRWICAGGKLKWMD